MTGAITYRIDANDRLLEVGGAWTDFARDNGGNPDPSAVIGRSLWDFIVDEGTRDVYRLIVAEVRARFAPIHIPFRCDSELVERHMTMTIAPGDAGEVGFICQLRHSHKRTLSKSANGNPLPTTVVKCDSCYRVHTQHGWKQCWDAVVCGEIEIDDRPIEIRRTSCQVCSNDRQQPLCEPRAPN